MESAIDVSIRSSQLMEVRSSRQSGFPRMASISCPAGEMESQLYGSYQLVYPSWVAVNRSI